MNNLGSREQREIAEAGDFRPRSSAQIPNPQIFAPLYSPEALIQTVNSVNYSSKNFFKSVYDPEEQKTCHQCRQKSLRLHSHCSNCKSIRRQLCGDCLKLRYGEYLLEVNENANWFCPFCRGICNCYCCRRKKGLAPIGLIHRKATELGFKSSPLFVSNPGWMNQTNAPVQEIH